MDYHEIRKREARLRNSFRGPTFMGAVLGALTSALREKVDRLTRGRGRRGPKVHDQTGAEEWLNSDAWVEVDSSNVKGISYHTGASTLYVEYKHRPHGRKTDVYSYYNVPKSVAREMFLSNSMGKFVWRRLRGVYPYRKVA